MSALGSLVDLAPDDAARRHRWLAISVGLINASFYYGNILTLDVGIRWQYWLVALQVAWFGVALVLSGRERLGLALQLSVLLVDAAWSAPGAPNHLWLQVWVTLALSLHARSPAESPFAMGTLRALFLIVYFWSGVQKVLHGTWLNGAFLSWSAAKMGKMEWLLAPLIPATELARLKALIADESMEGSFLPEAPLLVGLSIVVVLIEIVAPFLLVVPRTRAIAAWVTVVAFGGIATASREVVFGSLMLGLATLFVPAGFTRVHPWLVGVAFAVYAVGRAFLPGLYLN